MSREVNKSQEIRDFFAEYPDAKAAACVKVLGDRGIVVSPSLVAVVRAKIAGPGNKRRTKEVTLDEVKIVKAFVRRSDLEVSVATKILAEFCSLVDSLGGLDRFKEVLSEYQRYELGENGVFPEESDEF